MEGMQIGVYILLCGDSTLYTGWTNCLSARLAAHQSGRGAKYTKSRLPVQLVYFEKAATKADALKREYQIKHLGRSSKIALIRNTPLPDQFYPLPPKK